MVPHTHNPSIGEMEERGQPSYMKYSLKNTKQLK
ncbi:rCG58068 [Rattus norvegicus]|uniref:RCG58068 n=1 Tax=Rattus norvegicus TaxID=10116 RepID=A6J4I1_RAT|nr:rCG58068 [Rattus norvegicus]